MSEEKQFVEPRTLKGFQDLLPEDLIHRKAVIRTIESIFEKYGFLPLDTPALEHLDVLLGAGGEATNKELFRLETPEEEAVALRFDLTVPFARLLAQYPDKLKVPVRRYAIGPVWRADKPGPGRFRQFTQFDIDIAGAATVAVDAEIISIMCEVMDAIGATGYRVLVNDRNLIDALLLGCGIEDEDTQKHVLRVIDKLQKVGLQKVREELGEGRIDDSGDPIPGVHLDSDTSGRIVQFINITGAGPRRLIIQRIEELLPGTEAARAAIQDMKDLADALDALGVSEDHAVFDPSLARGLDYYTGPVFETVLLDAPQFGSVMGGGRYNRLVERFLDRAIPGTGMSIGLDRLMAALDHLGAVTPQKSTVQALVVSLGKVPLGETLKAAAELRAHGIRTEAYFGKKMRMKDQLSHADRNNIPVAVILGEDEIARGEVAIKDLAAGKRQREDIKERDAYRKAGKVAQVTVPRQEMVSRVLGLLG